MVRTLLVANRGEIARRIFRTCRRMGIRTVAVFSDADDRAPHVGEADVSVRLPGTTPSETYLEGGAILEAARATGADAIHPGYGFLSENAGFAAACAASGIVFVGPSPEVIESMGSKVTAKALMAAAGVPILPGMTVAAGTNLDDVAAAAGLPLLVKAAYGGGGRGMRVVRTRGDLDEAISSAQREAAAAFGNGAVFVERFVEHPRHIEVQIFGDQHGDVVHLFERECSIQRRYQKIIEESPSPGISDDVRDELCRAAVAAGSALGYVGAGTVEFVVDDEDQSFYFLEVNTRLQVEHPVTEMVTGLDLVEAQLRVARGEPLPAEVRTARVSGHAIEARLYAEDVTADYAPVSGRFDRLHIERSPELRVDSGYENGSIVSTNYDAMLAKVIAVHETRDGAADMLAAALVAAEVHGPATNRDLLVRVLEHPDFRAKLTRTSFLAEHDCAAPRADEQARERHAIAAALARQAERTATRAGPSGWRNVRSSPQRAHFDEIEVAYTFRREGLVVAVQGRPADAQLWSAAPDVVDLTHDGVRRAIRVHRVGRTVYVDDGDTSSTLVERERFPLPDSAPVPGSLIASMPGTVVRVQAEVGQHVSAGDVLVVLEAMKMEHSIASPTDGVVSEVLVAALDQVETGAVLAIVTEETEPYE